MPAHRHLYHATSVERIDEEGGSVEDALALAVSNAIDGAQHEVFREFDGTPYSIDELEVSVLEFRGSGYVQATVLGSAKEA